MKNTPVIEKFKYFTLLFKSSFKIKQISCIFVFSFAEQLKSKILDQTRVPICRQAIRGWPPAKLHDAQKATTQLCNLGLSLENELILIDLTEEGCMDVEK